MFRFTIRDVLWLTAVVAVLVVQQMDHYKLRGERAALIKREAELRSEAKMWQAEADRASLRAQDASEYSQKVQAALKRRGMNPQEVIEFNRTVRQMAAPEQQSDK